jgi:hypothetical protein
LRTRGHRVPGREPWRSATAAILDEHGLSVRRWRGSTTGCAYIDTPEIEGPEPRGRVSFAVLAHEVGHKALHHGRSKPRWLEEVEAWEYALAQFERFDLGEPGVGVMRRAERGIRHSFGMALRRGADPDRIATEAPWWWRRCMGGMPEELAA